MTGTHSFTWNKGLTTIVDRQALKLKKRGKGSKCPWLSYEIKTLMSTRDMILRKTRKTNKDWSSYKILKNLCNNKVKQAKQKYQNELSFENRSKATKFWKCFLQKNLYLSL